MEEEAIVEPEKEIPDISLYKILCPNNNQAACICIESLCPKAQTYLCQEASCPCKLPHSKSRTWQVVEGIY